MSVQQHLAALTDVDERALLAVALALEQGQLVVARDALDAADAGLPYFEQAALQEHFHPQRLWRWQLARYFRMTCGDYVATSERRANAEAFWRLASLPGAPVYWRVFAGRAFLDACLKTPRHAEAMDQLADLDLATFVAILPMHHQQRLWQQYYLMMSHLARSLGDTALAAEYLQQAYLQQGL